MPAFLKEHGLSFVITTYQYDHLVLVKGGDEKLDVKFIEHPKAMGVAIGQRQMFVGIKKGIAKYRAHPNVTTLPDYDAYYVYSGVHYTGMIDIHEIAIGRGKLWVVNTLFSCLCHVDHQYNFRPVWRPNFITGDYSPADKCHLNGVAMWNGLPRFVTCFGPYDEQKGWREGNGKQGMVIDITSGETVVGGLHKPHSPRVYDGYLYVLESSAGRMLRFKLDTWDMELVATLPGYVRGVAYHAGHALVATSVDRTDKNGGKSRVYLINLESGKVLDQLVFVDTISEIFDVQPIPVGNPYIMGLDDELLPTTYAIPKQDA